MMLLDRESVMLVQGTSRLGLRDRPPKRTVAVWLELEDPIVSYANSAITAWSSPMAEKNVRNVWARKLH